MSFPPSVCVIMPVVPGRMRMAQEAMRSIDMQRYIGTVELVADEADPKLTIGAMRNRLAERCAGDIIMHADDDDWSHPDRLAEQAALLQSSGAECVGYHDLLFYDERKAEAWLYSNPMPERFQCPPGAGIMYWRKTWQRKPFRDTSKGEDLYFTSGLRVKTASSIVNGEPRIIAGIHGGNTSSRIQPGSDSWRRVPQFDAYCRSHMSPEVAI